MTPFGLGWPNVISIARILLAPVLAVLILSRNDAAASAAAVLFVAGAATDGLDGYLARRYASATRLGQWLDPLADKVLIAVPVVTLTAIDRFPLWAALVIVFRELAVSLLRAWLGARGVGMPASRWGKAKTLSQIVAVSMYLLPVVSGDVRTAVLAVAVALTVWSGLDYFVKARRLIRSGSR
ncbi:MAG TPA: CDP-diacylglycerol--glycerol-3-phosphate 3-phosphatidyltransferase [Actinomycetota bacterium]|nr:CDP-diacylglycerol--glycerol-3-phosphate 3-phosphatidyltransferase [Actinomycetota bacterium]